MFIKKYLKQLSHYLPIKLQCTLYSIFFKGKLKIGKNSFVHPTAHIIGRKHITIGNNVCISEGCWLNVNHRIEEKTAILIGNNCFIGKNNFISSGDAVVIGDYTLTTLDCKFIGSSHKIDNPMQPIILSGTTLKDQIKIGVNCFIGASATVLGNITIGHGSIIGANSFVLSNIPAFSIAVGNPALVIKRYSFAKEKWVSISEFTKSDKKDLPSELDYLQSLNQNFNNVNLPWIAAGKSMGDI